MKYILIAFFSMSSAFACSCYSNEARLTYTLSKLPGVIEDSIRIVNVKERYHVILMIPGAIEAEIHPDRECRISCSLKGVRLTAYVEYDQNEKKCSAHLVKPAVFENKIKLSQISCN